MFTGIVTDIGQIRHVEKRGDTHIVIATHYDVGTIDIGASIACSGVCLTVVEKGSAAEHWFAVVASAETLSKTAIGGWKPGDSINLERPLRIGDELGGHIVSGHVDGVAIIADMRDEGESRRMTFEAPPELMRFIAPKGSVALDGVSLTVNEGCRRLHARSHAFDRQAPGGRNHTETSRASDLRGRLQRSRE